MPTKKAWSGGKTNSFLGFSFLVFLNNFLGGVLQGSTRVSMKYFLLDIYILKACPEAVYLPKKLMPKKLEADLLTFPRIPAILLKVK